MRLWEIWRFFVPNKVTPVWSFRNSWKNLCPRNGWPVHCGCLLAIPPCRSTFIAGELGKVCKGRFWKHSLPFPVAQLIVCHCLFVPTYPGHLSQSRNDGRELLWNRICSTTESTARSKRWAGTERWHYNDGGGAENVWWLRMATFIKHGHNGSGGSQLSHFEFTENKRTWKWMRTSRWRFTLYGPRSRLPRDSLHSYIKCLGSRRVRGRALWRAFGPQSSRTRSSHKSDGHPHLLYYLAACRKGILQKNRKAAFEESPRASEAGESIAQLHLRTKKQNEGMNSTSLLDCSRWSRWQMVRCRINDNWQSYLTDLQTTFQV